MNRIEHRVRGGLESRERILLALCACVVLLACPAGLFLPRADYRNSAA